MAEKTKGYQGTCLELEVRPGVKKKYIIGKLTPEEIKMVERDIYTDRRRLAEILKDVRC